MRLSPTARRRRLARELVKRREQAKLTAVQAAALASCTQSQITNLEKAKIRTPNLDLVLKLLKAYGVDEHADQEMILSWAMPIDGRPYWHKYTGLTEEHQLYIGLEEEAKVLRCYEPQIIHGLMQTEDYIKALILGRVPGASDDFINTRVGLKLERQRRLLSGDDRLAAFKVVMTEEAFLRPIGGRDVMLEQLERIKKLADLDIVDLHIIPLANGAHAGAAPCTIITFLHPLDPEAVYIETPTGELWVEGRQGVQNYEQVFEYLVRNAVPARDNVRVIDAAMRRLARQPAGIGTVGYGWVDLGEVPPQ